MTSFFSKPLEEVYEISLSIEVKSYKQQNKQCILTNPHKYWIYAIIHKQYILLRILRKNHKFALKFEKYATQFFRNLWYTQWP